MEDERIVRLFLARDETALTAAKTQYGAYCGAMARRMLGTAQDAEECLNSTLLAAWQSIPPNQPRCLRTYLAKLTRRYCLDVWRKRNADKRGAGTLPLVLEELQDALPNRETLEDSVNARALTARLNAFLRALPAEDRRLFLLRYWQTLPIREAAKQCGCTESSANARLHRLRKKLKDTLDKEGWL